MGEWQDRTALITGGGRGFGLAFGVALADRGAHVALVDVDGEAAKSAAASIRDRGGSAEAYEADVTDPDRMEAVTARAAEARGGIDLLINNAGLHSATYNKPILELGLENVRRLFEVNVLGVVTCTLAAVPFMRERADASVISLSSAAAYLGARSTAYGNSKLAVAGLTLTFAGELGPLGIRVNAIAPGLVLTDTNRAELSPGNLELAKSMQVIEADGGESDVVEAMLYLASRRARFVTGETLRVTGGMGAGV